MRWAGVCPNWADVGLPVFRLPCERGDCQLAVLAGLLPTAWYLCVARITNGLEPGGLYPILVQTGPFFLCGGALLHVCSAGSRGALLSL